MAVSVTWAPCKQLNTESHKKLIELNLTLWFTLLFSRDLTNIVTPFYLLYLNHKRTNASYHGSLLLITSPLTYSAHSTALFLLTKSENLKYPLTFND